jgi:CRP/FNR family transcriptional regulator
MGLLAQVARRRCLRKGEVLFLQGDPAEGFYIVGEGQLKVFQLSPQGREQILHVVGPGGSVAEAALFGGRTYPASAEALERTTVVFFPREDFARLLRSRPGLALNLIAALAQKLREFAGLIEQLSLASIRTRLAQYLLSQHALCGAGMRVPATTVSAPPGLLAPDPRGQPDAKDSRPIRGPGGPKGPGWVHLGVSKRALASRLGTVPETLSRSLAGLVRDGVVAVDGRRVRVLDAEALREIADGLAE